MTPSSPAPLQSTTDPSILQQLLPRLEAVEDQEEEVEEDEECQEEAPEVQQEVEA